MVITKAGAGTSLGSCILIGASNLRSMHVNSDPPMYICNGLFHLMTVHVQDTTHPGKVTLYQIL